MADFDFLNTGSQAPVGTDPSVDQTSSSVLTTSMPATMSPSELTPEEQQQLSAPDQAIPMVENETKNGQTVGPVLSDAATNAMSNVAYGLAGLPVGLIDTMGQSLGVFDDKTVTDAMNKLSPDGMGDFYSRNKTALRAGGETLGIFIPGMIGSKVLSSVRWAREAGALGEAAKSSTLVDTLLGSAANLTNLETKISDAAGTAATQKFGVFAGKTFAGDAATAQATRAYYTGKVVESARQTAAFEASYRLLYNDSETMNPADYTLSDQVMWGAGFGAANAALELVTARYAVRRLIQGAAKDAPPVSSFAQDIDQAVFRPGNRGAGITQNAALKSELKAIQDSGTLDQTRNTNFNADQTIIDKTLSTQVQKMAGDLHPIISRTTLSPDQVRLSLDALKQDETTFLYATKLGNVPDDPKAFYQDIAKLQDTTQSKLDKAKTEFSSLGPKANASPQQVQATLDPLRQARGEAEKAADEMHYVIENDGSWQDFQSRSPNYLDSNDFSTIKRTRYSDTMLNGTDLQNVSRTYMQPVGSPFQLHDDFRLANMPVSASPMDWSAAFAASSKLIDDYKPIVDKAGTPIQKFVLNDQMPWFQIEGTLALANAHPEVAQNIIYGGKFQNASDAAFGVLDQKYQLFNKLMTRTERRPLTGGTVLDKVGTYSPSEILQMLNLPQPIGMQAHPLVQTFAQGRLQGMKTLEEMFLPADKDLLTPNRGLDMLQQNMRETAGATDPNKTFALSGGLFNQNDVRPVFVAGRSVPNLARSDQVLHSIIEQNRQNVITRLGQIDETTAPLVSKVVKSVVGTGAANVARDVQSLNEGVLSGRGILTAQDRVANQEPTLKAAMLLSQQSEKIIEAHLGGTPDAPGIFDAVGLPQKVSSIFKQNNRPVLVDANRGIHAYRFGWDINKTVQNGDGSASFLLNKDSPINQKLLAQFFPDADKASDAVQYMPDMSMAARASGLQKLSIHKDAADLLDTVSQLSRQSGQENNGVKWAMNLPAIKIRDFHLPTPELGKDGTWFVKNSADKVVGTYSGPMSSQNRKLAEQAADQLSSANDAHIAVSLDDIRRQHDIFADDSFFNLIDYSDQLAKTGSAISGGLAKAQIDTGPETMKSMLNTLTTQFLNVGTRARALVFEPELNYAKQAAQTAGYSDHFREMNVWDRYRSIIYNTTPQSREGAITKVYNTVENLADSALSFAYAHMSELSASTPEDKTQASNLKNLIRKSSSPDLYTQYQKRMSNWSPFTDADAFAQSTYNAKSPPDVRSMMATVARVSSSMSLRFADVGSALLNLASLATNAPAVLTAMRPMANESVAEHAARTASWGIEWGAGIKTFSAMKAMQNTTKALWNGELSAPMQQAASMGMFETEYASLAKIFGESTVGAKGQFARFMDAGSKLADSSETMSRMVSWGMGYKIAKDLGKFDDERNAFIFANNFANDMIGNYSPKNKPIMFQGALGLPLGSFQTYMFNYYRRIFDYVERGDSRSVIAAYAAQASVFGAKSVPGFGLFNDHVLNNPYNGDSYDSRIHRDLPPAAYELLMHGSLSSIPAIFGQGGLSFYTRGSVDMTSLPPTPMDLQRSPPFQFLANTGEGIKRTIQNVFSSSGFSTQQQEEILANFGTNRLFKNIMEMAANAKTDQQGNVVDLGTRDGIHLATLALGSQPTRVQELTEAYNSQRQVELNQSALRTRLNDHTRALMRGGEFGVDSMQGLVHDYTKSGGNPAYLGEWLRNTMETSVTPKSTAKLKQLMGSKQGTEFMNMLTAIQQ